MRCSYKETNESNPCPNQGSPQTSAWNVGALCPTHYDQVKKLYPTGLRSQALDDFVKVHVLLQFNKDMCRECIDKLDAQMIRAKGLATQGDPRFSKTNAGDKYLKLSRALEYYEGYCWFPANRILLTGILSPKAFYNNLKYGFNKDPGARPSHGDQTHRLQWHVIMRCMTKNFEMTYDQAAGWTHSPLGLFYEYTQRSESKPGDTMSGAWAVSMDRRENKGWGNPDFVVPNITGGNGHMLITEALRRREEKISRLKWRTAELLGTFKTVMAEYTKKKTGSKTGSKTGPKYEQQDDDALALRQRMAPDTLRVIDENLVKLSMNGFNKDYTYADQHGSQPTHQGRF